MGHEAAMAHANHFLIVAAEGLRRHGQPVLASKLAWAIEDHFVPRESPRRDKPYFDRWLDACRALGPAPERRLDLDEAVALACAAILGSDE